MPICLKQEALDNAPNLSRNSWFIYTKARTRGSYTPSGTYDVYVLPTSQRGVVTVIFVIGGTDTYTVNLRENTVYGCSAVIPVTVARSPFDPDSVDFDWIEEHTPFMTAGVRGFNVCLPDVCPGPAPQTTYGESVYADLTTERESILVASYNNSYYTDTLMIL